MPLSALAAVVIVAVARADRHPGGCAACTAGGATEFGLALVAFAGVAVLGLLWGIGVAIALSLLNFIRRAWYPHDAVLGRVDHLKGYHDTQRYPDARRVPGLVLYRFDAPLFFANADLFRAHVLRLADGAERIVVAAEPITDIDATAGEMLGTLIGDLRARGVELAFAELKDPMRDLLRRYGIEPRTLPDARRRGRRRTCATAASNGTTGKMEARGIEPLPRPCKGRVLPLSLRPRDALSLGRRRERRRRPPSRR